ncbi:hypothetical protein ABES02_01470 [Neobacillus pocheonensis]|uniref:hypothetical protein n=1 Tax=Neobacillus pocheonensis TaxID=363869 RepID=UPI003D2D4D64
MDMPHEEFLWMFNINQHSVIYGIQAAGNAMEGGDYHAGFCGVKQFCNVRFVRVIEKNTAL